MVGTAGLGNTQCWAVLYCFSSLFFFLLFPFYAQSCPKSVVLADSVGESFSQAMVCIELISLGKMGSFLGARSPQHALSWGNQGV